MSDYDQLLELIRSRRSIRQFQTALSVGKRLRVCSKLRAGRRRTITASPGRFLVIEDKQQIDQLAEIVRLGLSEKLKSLPEAAATYAGEFTHYATFFSNAPMLFGGVAQAAGQRVGTAFGRTQKSGLVSGETFERGHGGAKSITGGTGLGLGTCVLTGPLLIQDALAGALDLPPVTTTCLVVLGHPAESPAPPRRKTVEQIVEFRNNPRRT